LGRLRNFLGSELLPCEKLEKERISLCDPGVGFWIIDSLRNIIVGFVTLWEQWDTSLVVFEWIDEARVVLDHWGY
jgi:hypothetical protein